jgi:PKD repeat protein
MEARARSFRSDLRAASSALVAILVSGALFVGSAGVILAISHDQAESLPADATEAASLHSRATSVLDLLMQSPGFAYDLDDDVVFSEWTVAPDLVAPPEGGGPESGGRLGLLSSLDPGLSYDKFHNLQDAEFEENNADGHVNYIEARRALGLDQYELDFHIRAFPSLPDVCGRLTNVDEEICPDGVAGQLHPIKVTYVGHFACPNHPSSTDECEYDLPATDDDPTPWENDYLEQLVDGFCPFLYDTDTRTPLAYEGGAFSWPGSLLHEDLCALGQRGDVIPDNKDLIQDELKDRLQDPAGNPDLSEVNVLILGSEVDHSALQSAQIENQVAPWVLAGGYLIVLGTHSTNTQWLNSLYHLGIHSSGGGVLFNDENHPVLHEPNELDYTQFDPQGQAWQYTGSGADSFATVAQTTGSGPPDSILAISDPGAFGEGNIVFTSWFPYDLLHEGPGVGYHQGLSFVDNLLNLGRHRTLYLDYGPEMPQNAPVVPGVARSFMDVSQVWEEYGSVAMTVILWVFPQTAESITSVDESPATTAPQALFGVTCVYLVCTFDGTNSYDVDGTIVHYAWDFGDGTTQSGPATIDHTYAAVGTYLPSLNVTDDDGLTDVRAHTLDATGTGGNGAPVAAFTFDCDGANCAFTSTSVDPDLDSLEFLWVFRKEGTSPEEPPEGTSPEEDPEFWFSTDGAYLVTLIVEDAVGETHQTTQTVVVELPELVFPAGTPYESGSRDKVDLTWSDATAYGIDVYVDGVKRITYLGIAGTEPFDAGKKQDIQGTYTYQACHKGTTVCAASINLLFPP